MAIRAGRASGVRLLSVATYQGSATAGVSHPRTGPCSREGESIWWALKSAQAGKLPGLAKLCRLNSSLDNSDGTAKDAVPSNSKNHGVWLSVLPRTGNLAPRYRCAWNIPFRDICAKDSTVEGNRGVPLLNKVQKREAQDRLRKRLKEARDKSGLTQTELAKAIGQPQSYIYKREAGDRDIAAVELQELAKALEVNILFFFDT